MKCSRCNFDAKYPQRRNRTCPQCKGAFAFEPRERDPVTDMLFKNAIDAVSASGQVRFGVEHLYYEVCRRKRRTMRSLGPSVGMIAGGLLGGAWLILKADRSWVLGAVLAVGLWGVIRLVSRRGAKYVGLTPDVFRGLYDRWCRAHGAPESVIQRRAQPAPTPQSEPDLGDYSFDRAVICDRARTVDLLLANNFHFENNCAILSIDGYPPGPFALVQTMLQRNPNLHVFVLHDATPEGCRLAQRLRHDRGWFPASVRIIDVGLRPGHARQFVGLWQRVAGIPITPGHGITRREAPWLSRHRLELAAVRPAQVIKRLFRAMNRQSLLDARADGSSTTSTDTDADMNVLLFIDQDDTSFSTNADAADTRLDAFG